MKPNPTAPLPCSRPAQPDMFPAKGHVPARSASMQPKEAQPTSIPQFWGTQPTSTFHPVERTAAPSGQDRITVFTRPATAGHATDHEVVIYFSLL